MKLARRKKWISRFWYTDEINLRMLKLGAVIVGVARCRSRHKRTYNTVDLETIRARDQWYGGKYCEYACQERISY